jgi:class 3 adenylate cyclase/tetratricopeptide (TPR) repeat protein
VHCTACGKENRDDARFCRGCGQTLHATCPGCGADAPGDGAFCDRCGARLAAAPSPPPSSYTPAHLAARIRATRAAVEGERKLVTVLFADVVNSTAMAEHIDPEEMRAIVDRCFGHMLEEVHRFEGTVNQFTGDGVMALFGAPLALEDAPRRAVLAALAIQRALAASRDTLPDAAVDLQIRIGIHTGLVVFGRIGNDLRVEYTAIGDTTNLAARLQTLAEPGTVVMSEATRRLVAPFFDVRDLGMRSVKGRTDAVHVFEVTGERSARDRIDARAAEGLTPLAGRAGELVALRAAFDSAREGHGRVVFVVGEAGIGKSRLLYEFRRALVGESHTWVEGRCASYGRATAFLPLVDLWRRSLRIDDTDDERTAIGKVDAGIAALGADVAWTTPFVQQLLSLPSGNAAADALDAASRRAETFRALKALTLRAADAQPIVMLVEDVHWIDAASEEFLEYVADAVPAARILLLITHRPGYRHPFGDRSYHARVVLHALGADDMAAMAGAILDAGELPAELRTLIAGKAEGNPLFVEEVTKSLIEEGVLRRDGGHIVVTRALADVAVPDSIHGVLMARLDRLDDAPKHALQMASVIGREFAHRLLARVTEIGEGESSLVAELRALELIYEKAAHPELAYMFKHALTHDVAYESILVQRRKELHHTIGRAIEELYSDRLPEHYETLALHFTRAEDWPRAFEYLTRAAEKALASYANHAAVTHCRDALAVADRLGNAVSAVARCNLEEMLGAANMWITEFAASGEAFRRAAALADTPARRSLSLGWSSHSFLWGHRYDTANEVLREAAAVADAHDVTPGRALASLLEGFRSAVTEGDLVGHVTLTERAIALAEQCDDPVILSFGHFMRGEILEWRGEFEDSLRHLERALAIGRTTGNPSLTVMPSWWIGKSSTALGRYAWALESLREGEALCARIGNRAWQSRLLNTIGWCLAEIGDHANARGYNVEAERLARDVGDPEILANSGINLALNALGTGDVDGAMASVAPFAATLDVPGDPWMRWRYSLHVRDALGRIALVRREPDEALALADVELAAAAKLELKRIMVRAIDLRARALLDLDRREEGRAALADALALAERIKYPPGEWKARALLAELDRRDGARSAAEAQLARARARVDAVAAPLPDDLRHALYAGVRLGHDSRP